jgi:hypothetical protein
MFPLALLDASGIPDIASVMGRGTREGSDLVNRRSDRADTKIHDALAHNPVGGAQPPQTHRRCLSRLGAGRPVHHACEVSARGKSPSSGSS